MEQLGRVREIAERIAASEGMEVVEVEWLGRGQRLLLRIFLDKPGGVNLQDCQTVSEQVGAVLDAEDLIPQSYTLEVSSPGLDRKLVKPADYQRFAGRLIQVNLKAPREGRRRFRGRLLGMENQTIRVDLGEGQIASFELSEVARANLVIEL